MADLPVVTSKPWYQSKTIWSDVLTFVMALVPVVDGLYGTHIAENPLYGQALMCLGLVGIHGRINADTKIGG